MRTAILALALLWGCHSDDKLHDGLGNPPASGTGTTPNGGTNGTNPNGTTPNGGTNPSGTNPSTQSTPAGDDDDATTGNGGGGDTGSTSTTSDTGLSDDAFCKKAASLAGFLDKFQTPDDGKVVFCHSGSGSHYNKIDTDISACLPHLAHKHDVFPTTGCDS